MTARRNSPRDDRQRASARRAFGPKRHREEMPDEAEFEGLGPPPAGESAWDPFDPDEQEPEPEYGDFWPERDEDDA
jgi:hypothetical protein